MPGPRLPQLYAVLRETARRQLDALAAEDMEAFTLASEDRERAFEAVRANDAELPGLDEALLAEIRTTIAQILADDAKTQELATRSAARIQDELGTLQNGMSALTAYASEALQPSYFIDRSS